MKFPLKVRELILRRAAGRCEICGGTMPMPQIHHRRPRGMGGSVDPACGTPANALAIHPQCHRRVEVNREDATERGWIVLQGADPARVPVRLWDGYWMLATDGSMRPSGPSNRPGRQSAAGTALTEDLSVPHDGPPSH